ncbi:1,2-dihydroxy-3-keto-5-methylthiopentene dioxygenase [Rhizophlyctis rosea]|uniref:Acireductone dioxygenase n=1 Tax=Rhizophlyctis rosea TaxID=64517 RepID=A0AAD5SJF3_9FUNG|nr:1,2-dihydroxy-3-keto-5-methylthiopentene dioxygenase [Rhizophlyctis rosea]
MVQAWYYADSEQDGRELHQYTPNRPVSLEQLAAIGVEVSSVDVTQPDYIDKIDSICKERDYKNRDEITISKEKLPGYEEKLKIFFTEHLHEDEEIRFIVEGTGYFDVRSPGDQWIRIACGPSDLIVLPAGIYHRFTLDTSNYLKAMRLFKEDPKWTPLNRGPVTDENSYRQGYLESFVKAAGARFADEASLGISQAV